MEKIEAYAKGLGKGVSTFFLSFKMITPFDGFSFLPHQNDALIWMIGREKADAEFVRGGILADEMGLGKTWMTIGLLLNEVVSKTLLLVPPALQPQWSDALKQASIPHRVFGLDKKGDSWRTVPGVRDFEVCVATYDRASANAQFLASTEAFGRIVCDEGHLLRNGPSIARFRNIMAIDAPRRWILSGTPVQNSASDFMNLLRFLKMDDALRLKTPSKEIASVVLLRRTVGMVRGDVAAMPTLKPTHVVHPVTMPAGSEEEKVFHALVRRLEHAVESHAKTMIVLELFLRIRQFLAHPDIYVQSMRKKFPDHYERQRWEGTASKMAAFDNFLETSEKEPTIVFGTFVGEMDLAEVSLKHNGYTVFNIRGGMNDSQREAVTSESKKLVEAGIPVALIVQIMAGGAGLNLQHCSRVFFLSSHWNPAIVDQAIARAYRMGQTCHVTVHHLLLADGEEKNVDRLMTGLHGLKRTAAMSIHDKLFCDSAVDTEEVLKGLDAVLPPPAKDPQQVS